ncbi:FAD-dependent oxidoreductase [Candidatus Aerophobetes bacterium]|nr:FAD-dependent oxidoreductase [Candidatus Aerophobetes bacterium]
MRRETVDVCIIGAGPAGLAAGIAASKEGVDDVLILDRNREAGGILFQCIHNGFGLHLFKEDLTGPEYAQRFIREAEKRGIKIKPETVVLKINKKKEVIASTRGEGIFKVMAKAIVLATGCREKTRHMLHIPGYRPSGIFTAGLAQQFINIEGYLPGKKAVILGSGDIGLIMARRLTLEGAKVLAVVEIMPYPGGSTRNVAMCLQDFDIPLFLEHTVIFIHGKRRLEGVTVAKVNSDKKPIFGTEKFIPCDTLLVAAGLIPESELCSEAGIEIDAFTQGPVVDEKMQTSVEGIFACGNVCQVQDLVDYVSYQGEIAGKNAARFVLGKMSPFSRFIKIKRGENIRMVVPQLISGKEPVNLFIRVKRPQEDVRLCVGEGLLEKHFSFVKPNQMIVWKVPFDKLNLGKIKELEIKLVNK